MSENLTLVINDVHLADKPPSSRTDTYTDDIFEKLVWCANYAIKNGIPRVVQAGDFFHIKTPSRNSHRLVQRVCEEFVKPLLDAGIDLSIVPGNHDLQNDRLESLADAPLGVLQHAGATLLIGPHPRGLPIFGIPFLQDWRDLPRWMDDFGHWCEEGFPSHPLMVTHAPIMPPKIDAIYEYIPADVWASLLRVPTLVVYGHIHESHGVYPVGDHTFSNPGALSRGSLHESDLKRPIRVTLVDHDKATLRHLDVPHRKSEDVYVWANIEAANKTELHLGEFLAQVGSTTLAATSTEAILQHIQTMDIPPLTRQYAVEILESVSSL